MQQFYLPVSLRRLQNSFAYQAAMVRAEWNFEGSCGVYYDRCYRREALASKNLDWSIPNIRLYNEAFTGHARSLPRCSDCLQDDHASSICARNPARPWFHFPRPNHWQRATPSLQWRPLPSLPLQLQIPAQVSRLLGPTSSNFMSSHLPAKYPATVPDPLPAPASTTAPPGLGCGSTCQNLHLHTGIRPNLIQSRTISGNPCLVKQVFTRIVGPFFFQIVFQSDNV